LVKTLWTYISRFFGFLGYILITVLIVIVIRTPFEESIPLKGTLWFGLVIGIGVGAWYLRKGIAEEEKDSASR
jgi:hypothetical protein